MPLWHVPETGWRYESKSAPKVRGRICGYRQTRSAGRGQRKLGFAFCFLCHHGHGHGGSRNINERETRRAGAGACGRPIAGAPVRRSSIPARVTRANARRARSARCVNAWERITASVPELYECQPSRGREVAAGGSNGPMRGRFGKCGELIFIFLRLSRQGEQRALKSQLCGRR
jgi:hypothetical protein